RSCRIRPPSSSKSCWWRTDSCTFPYSSDVPAVSNFSSSTPWSTTDWRRFRVPTVFAITVSYGRCHDSPTCAWAPRWKMYGRSGASQSSRTSRSIEWRSVRSAQWTLILLRRCQMLFRAPLEVARTKAWTFASRATSASVRWEPMNPSAPVTRTVRPVKASPSSLRREASDSSVQVVSWPGAVMMLRMPARADTSMPRTRKSAVRSGASTALAGVAVAGSAAGAGILLAHLFGRNERTDGLLVAYGVYLVIAIAAQSFRTVVLPGLTRAAADGTLGSETRAYLLALTGAGVVAVSVTALLAHPLGRVLTTHPASAKVAAEALPWFAAAGFLQLIAALAASALAASD